MRGQSGESFLRQNRGTFFEQLIILKHCALVIFARFSEFAQGRQRGQIRSQFAKRPGSETATDGVSVRKASDKPGPGLLREFRSCFSESANGPVAIAAQDIVIAEIIVKPKIENIGIENS